MPDAVEFSHGRGGAGNFGADDTKYVDGGVVRTGVEGSHQDGAFSSGRGGAGNIADVGTQSTARKDHDAVPDEAIVRASGEGHTGRGGAGNVDPSITEPEKSAHAEEGAPVGLADKLKGKLFGAFGKK